MRIAAALFSCLAGALVCAEPARAVISGQLDTFEDGTSDSWMNGFGDLATGTGGPAGAADHFLRIDADGNGAGGKLVGYNSNQWTGNFVLAGVNSIEMDLKAISITAGASVLTVRIAFRSATGALISAGASGYVSSAGAVIAVDGQWHHVVFRFSSLIPINSSGGVPPAPLNTFLRGPAEFRIIHAASPSLVGDAIIASMGIDNIHAIPSLSVVSFSRSADKIMHLNFRGEPNLTYAIEATSDLTQPYIQIGTTTSAADGTFGYDDLTAPSFPKRFYRATRP